MRDQCQGDADNFLESQLKPGNLEAAAAAANYPMCAPYQVRTPHSQVVGLVGSLPTELPDTLELSRCVHTSPRADRRQIAVCGPCREMRMQPGYDHSYFFIATFMEDHVRFHAKALLA